MQIAMNLEFKPERREPKQPTSRNGKALLQALQAGHKPTPLTAPVLCGLVALSQECGRLRALGWNVQSRTIKTATGKSVSEYFIAQ